MMLCYVYHSLCFSWTPLGIAVQLCESEERTDGRKVSVI